MEGLGLLDVILGYLDIIYIITCNAASYIILEVINKLTKDNILETVWKRFISAAVAIIIGVIMVDGFGHEVEPIFYGFFIQFLTWDYLFKYIIKWIQRKYKA